MTQAKNEVLRKVLCIPDALDCRHKKRDVSEDVAFIRVRLRRSMSGIVDMPRIPATHMWRYQPQVYGQSKVTDGCLRYPPAIV